MGRVALVTAAVVDHDDDRQALLAALEAAGVEAASECWDDHDVVWGSYQLAVLRSTWDYTWRRDEFFAWLSATEQVVTLANPAAAVRWNSDKHYLLDLEARGLPIVPSTFFDPGSAQPASVPEFNGDIVVKPAVGAGGRDAGRYSTRTEADAHLEALLGQGRAVLVQPYANEIDDEGETGLVYFDGRYSHAFGKAALLGRDAAPSNDVFIPEQITRRVPSALERALADAVVAEFAPGLLYARVDLVRRANQTPLILEVELIEPSFFFHVDDSSPARFAAAIRRRLR